MKPRQKKNAVPQNGIESQGASSDPRVPAAFRDFIERLELISKEKPDILLNTLSNVFAMRAVGNKTHGDLAEIALSEFVNFFVYDFSSLHVGKANYRKKTKEEDISVTCKAGTFKGVEIPVSVKAYGVGPLQLSTDKDNRLFPFLKTAVGKEVTEGKAKQAVSNEIFEDAAKLNVLPLIYDKKNGRCNIMLFDFKQAFDATARIVLVPARKRFDSQEQAVISGSGRKHPIYLFLDSDGKYLFEVRYGGASANALQRGLWTNTQKADASLFTSVTGGWVKYADRPELVQLIAVALNATPSGHKDALTSLETDIETLKRSAGLP